MWGAQCQEGGQRGAQEDQRKHCRSGLTDAVLCFHLRDRCWIWTRCLAPSSLLQDIYACQPGAAPSVCQGALPADTQWDQGGWLRLTTVAQQLLVPWGGQHKLPAPASWVVLSTAGGAPKLTFSRLPPCRSSPSASLQNLNFKRKEKKASHCTGCADPPRQNSVGQRPS